MIKRLSVPRIFLFALIALMSACATAPSEPKAEVVVERAKARWEALLDGDPNTAYSYLSPGYRSKVPYEDYLISLKLRRVIWTAAEYVDHTCEGEVCSVRFKVGIKVHRPVPGLDVFESSERLTERWLKIDGNWWYLPEN
jgi:hypothetical protein